MSDHDCGPARAVTSSIRVNLAKLQRNNMGQRYTSSVHHGETCRDSRNRKQHGPRRAVHLEAIRRTSQGHCSWHTVMQTRIAREKLTAKWEASGMIWSSSTRGSFGRRLIWRDGGGRADRRCCSGGNISLRPVSFGLLATVIFLSQQTSHQ
jgi:hypothetical protein